MGMFDSWPDGGIVLPTTPEREGGGRPRGPRSSQLRPDELPVDAYATLGAPSAGGASILAGASLGDRTVRFLDCATITPNGTVPLQAFHVGQGSTLEFTLVVVSASASIGFQLVVRGGSGDGNWRTVSTITVSMAVPGYFAANAITGFGFDWAQCTLVDLANATQIVCNGEAKITGQALAAGAAAGGGAGTEAVTGTSASAATRTGDGFLTVTGLGPPSRIEV